MGKKILVLDGGGVRGIMQIQALVIQERETGVKTCDYYDLIVGTSIGSIIGAMIAMGTSSAADLLAEMERTLPKVFKRVHFKGCKYSKDPLKKRFAEMFGPGVKLGDVKCDLVITAYERTEGRTHFFKSWEIKDSRIGLFDAVDRSSAAPMYFNQIEDTVNAKVWWDGGVSCFNNPAGYAYVESVRKGWIQGGVECFSIGCGHTDNSKSFVRLCRERALKQLLSWMNFKNGGTARLNAPRVVDDLCEGVQSSKWIYHRIDCVIDKKIDGMDKIKYLNNYKELGKGLGDDLLKASRKG